MHSCQLMLSCLMLTALMSLMHTLMTPLDLIKTLPQPFTTSHHTYPPRTHTTYLIPTPRTHAQPTYLIPIKPTTPHSYRVTSSSSPLDSTAASSQPAAARHEATSDGWSSKCSSLKPPSKVVTDVDAIARPTPSAASSDMRQ